MAGWKRLMVLLFLLIPFATGCSGTSQEIVATINDTKVTKPEFMLYLYEVTQDFKMIGGEDIWETDFDGQSAEELVKERTLTTIQNVLLSIEQAQKYGVTLQEEDKEAAKQEGDALWESMTEEEQKQVGISKENLYRVMENTKLYQKVYQEMTKDYELSDEDFQKYYEKNSDSYKDSYTQYTLSSILVSEKSTAEKVVKKARAGEDFQSLFHQYEISEEEKEIGGQMETYKENLESVFGVDFDLEVGDISEPLYTQEGYFILKVDDKNILDDTKLKELAKADYTNGMKQQIFNAEYNIWLSEAKVEKNEEVWKEIKMLP
ncbi:MAG: hypothetical protein GX299_00745 [Epulopiscium sp.]|nr:hypothetical protein [Candidatus Epulonipiscium sp.]